MVIVGLDKDRNVLEWDIPYTNLVWLRRYFECGEFQMQIPASVYNPNVKFLVDYETNKELAVVQRRRYSSDDGGSVLLSGFFAEKLLDNYCVRERFRQTGYVNVLCGNLFTLHYSNLAGTDLVIYKENSANIGSTYSADFIGDQLGTKMYSMLETRGASQKVNLIPDGQSAVWKCWEGVNRSSSQTANEPVVFRSMYGDLANIEVDIDESAIKNTFYWLKKVNDVIQSTGHYEYFSDIYGPTTPANRGAMRELAIEYEPSSDEQFPEQVFYDKARESYDEHRVVTDIDATIVNANDVGAHLSARCDLGDVVTLEIDELGIMVDTRIVEVEEVYNNDGRTVNVAFGSKRISNLRRAFNAWAT